MNTHYLEKFYGRRKGKALSSRQQNLHLTLMPHVLLSLSQEEYVDLRGVFNNCYDHYRLEIGFGGGEHLAAQAHMNPDVGYIGVEAFMNGVVSLLSLIQRNQLKNIRIFPNDVHQLLKKLPSHSLKSIYILFPDPWPKNHHHKRRLINENTLSLMADLLVPGGELRISSDHQGYIRWILKKAASVPKLIAHFDPSAPPTERPQDHPPTRYEEKALKKGLTCYYLRYCSTGGNDY